MKTDYELLTELIKISCLYNPEWHYINGLCMSEEEALSAWRSREKIFSICDEIKKPYYKQASEIIDDCNKTFATHGNLFEELKEYEMVKYRRQLRVISSLTVAPTLIGKLSNLNSSPEDLWKAYREYRKVCELAFKNVQILSKIEERVFAQIKLVPTEEFYSTRKATVTCLNEIEALKGDVFKREWDHHAERTNEEYAYVVRVLSHRRQF